MTAERGAGAPADDWRPAAGAALGWMTAGLAISPVGTRIVGILGARWLASGVDDAATRVEWGASLTRGLVVPALLGPAVLLFGVVRLARAMREAPGGDSPVFAFGPVLVGIWLLARAAMVPVVLLTDGSGPLYAGVWILGLFPPVVALLLLAATAARARVAFLVWAAWAVALVALIAAGTGLTSGVSGGPEADVGVVADLMVAALLGVGATVVGGVGEREG